MELTKEDIVHLRLLKSGLIKPFNNATECVEKLFGIQSQVQQFGEVSIFNRVKTLTLKDLQKLYDSHQLIKIWAHRMTVHMFSINDWEHICHIYSDKNNFVKKWWEDKSDLFNAIVSDLEKLSKYEKFGKDIICEIVEKHTPHITEDYKNYGIILEATLNGKIFGIPETPHTKYFVHRNSCKQKEITKEWNGNKERSLGFMLMNYFHNFGPASINDFCHWSGLTKTEIKPVLDTIEEDLISVDYEGKKLYLPKDDEDMFKSKERSEKIILLGKFDPLFVSYADKEWIADKKQQKQIWRPAAHVEAVLIVNEKLMGTWRYVIKGKKINFNFELFDRVNEKTKKSIFKEAAKISKFLHKELGDINYNIYK